MDIQKGGEIQSSYVPGEEENYVLVNINIYPIMNCLMATVGCSLLEAGPLGGLKPLSLPELLPSLLGHLHGLPGLWKHLILQLLV